MLILITALTSVHLSFVIIHFHVSVLLKCPYLCHVYFQSRCHSWYASWIISWISHIYWKMNISASTSNLISSFSCDPYLRERVLATHWHKLESQPDFFLHTDWYYVSTLQRFLIALSSSSRLLNFSHDLFPQTSQDTFFSSSFWLFSYDWHITLY